MTLEWKLYHYNGILSKCKILLVLQEKSLIGCIIFIIIEPYSHAYMRIMILLGLISTYDFDYDFDIMWSFVNSIWVWYDCMIFSIIITLSISLSSYPITCMNHQVTYHLVNSGYYDFECVFMELYWVMYSTCPKFIFGHGWIYQNPTNSLTHESFWQHTIQYFPWWYDHLNMPSLFPWSFNHLNGSCFKLTPLCISFHSIALTQLRPRRAV